YTTQCDVKNHWPSGHVMLIILSAKILATGNHAVTSGGSCSHDSGTPPASLPSSTSVTFGTLTRNGTSTGHDYTATASTSWADYGGPSGSGTCWLNGPLVWWCREIVAPSYMGSPDTVLRVFFEPMIYNDGHGGMYYTVDNTRNIADLSVLSYFITI